MLVNTQIEALLSFFEINYRKTLTIVNQLIEPIEFFLPCSPVELLWTAECLADGHHCFSSNCQNHPMHILFHIHPYTVTFDICVGVVLTTPVFLHNKYKTY